MKTGYTVKGREILKGGEVVGKIIGSRSWWRGKPVGTYEILWAADARIEGYWCYFADVVKHIKNLEG